MELGILIPIVAIIMGISIPITAIKLKHRERIEQMRLAATGSRDDGLSARQEARIEDLEDRLRVLERIVTDGGYDLAQKIEALRDDRPVEARSTRSDLEARV
jgi:hypothetical protein